MNTDIKKKCENLNCQNFAIKQYKTGWYCSAHCACAASARLSSHHGKGHHKCNKCNLEFDTKRELHQHKVDIHYGNEIHVCICGKEFNSKRSLGTHKQSCEDVLKQNGQLKESYICNGCNKEFKSRSALQSHLSHCDKYEKLPEKGFKNLLSFDGEHCQYGCGQKANFILNNGTHCCSEFSTQCPIIKQLNSNSIKAIYQNRRDKNFKIANFDYDSLPDKTKLRMINRSNSKTCGKYKGIEFQCSYELAWVIYNLEHKIPFKRSTKHFKYFDSLTNKYRNYYPDFELEDGTIIEIKGWYNQNAIDKVNAVKDIYHEKILVLQRKDLDKEFVYVETKYGKDFMKYFLEHKDE